jgi:hypothetical protein
MTLKELLNRCDFRDIAAVIKDEYPDYAMNMTHFKEAFDVLQHLEPELNPDYESYQKVTLSKSDYEEDEKKGKKRDYYISAHCGGDYWESDLAKEVVVSDELTLTDNETAAHCLWEMTFYGNHYNEEEFDEVCRRIRGKIDTSNPYTVAADKLERKLLDSLYLNVDDMIPREHKNRPKRMRDHRQEQRIKQLERMAKIEDDIRRLTAGTESFKREELEYLFKTDLIYADRYHSFAYNPDQRMDYLIDLLSNYGETPPEFSKFTHFILMFRTASEYPLVKKEQNMIRNFFSQYLPASANIRYGYGTDKNLDTEVSLFLVCSY